MQPPGGHIFPQDAVFAAKLLPLPWGGIHPPVRGTVVAGGHRSGAVTWGQGAQGI